MSVLGHMTSVESVTMVVVFVLGAASGLAVGFGLGRLWRKKARAE